MEEPLENRRSEVDALFSAALDLPPDHRKAFLENACGDDVELRQAVEILLQGAEKEDLFLAPQATHRGSLRRRLANPLETAMRTASDSEQTPQTHRETPTRSSRP
ncbi:MAG: hypothetical protein K0U98_23540 [Deltaproteobacteria bacterium]|nr:hypothetical protein [Deltaproteobacteria bacterium]